VVVVISDVTGIPSHDLGGQADGDAASHKFLLGHSSIRENKKCSQAQSVRSCSCSAHARTHYWGARMALQEHTHGALQAHCGCLRRAECALFSFLFFEIRRKGVSLCLLYCEQEMAAAFSFHIHFLFMYAWSLWSMW